MLRLSKKVEYALLAINHIAMNPGEVHSAQKVAEAYGISFEFLSKALQALVRGKLIYSHQGVHGGYMLARSAEEISIGEVISAVESKKTALVQCAAKSPEECRCTIYDRCTIKMPMMFLQEQIEILFNKMSVAQMATLTKQSPSKSTPITISLSEVRYNAH